VSDTTNREQFTIAMPCVFRFTEANPADIGSEHRPLRAQPVNGVNHARVAALTRMIEARLTMHRKISESTLPDIAKAQLRKRFDGMTHFTEADVDGAIQAERDYLYNLFQNSVI
jgi:hypothetical protein